MPLAAAGLFFGGCREAKKKNCRELFYRHYEAQVKGFMRATPDANPLLSRKVAEYMLNRMFELDTAFVCLEGEALEAFQRKYGRLLQREYDSVVAVYGDCRGRFEKCMMRISRALCVRCSIRIRSLPGKESHSP